MGALAKSRSTKQQLPPPGVIPSIAYVPIADNVKIFPGALVVLDAGYLKPATAATGKYAIGCAASGGPGFSGQYVFDNTVTGHAAGAFKVPVNIGVFNWDIKSGDEVAQADVGSVCWIEDDHTVRKTAAGTSAAGRLIGIDGTQALVLTYPGMSLGNVAAAQANSTAATAADAVVDFNALLAKLRAAGLIAS